MCGAHRAGRGGQHGCGERRGEGVLFCQRVPRQHTRQRFAQRVAHACDRRTMATDMDDALMRALSDMDPANRLVVDAAPQGAEDEEQEAGDAAPGEDAAETGAPGAPGEGEGAGQEHVPAQEAQPGEAPAEQGDGGEAAEAAAAEEEGAPPMEEWKKEQMRCVWQATSVSRVNCSWCCPFWPSHGAFFHAPGPPVPGRSCPCSRPSRRWDCWTRA